MVEKISTRLENFPISFLVVPLGLSGLALAWQKAEGVLLLPLSLSPYLTGLAVLSLLIVLITYFAKVIIYIDEVKKEFNSPIKINFYPILAKVLLILSIIYLANEHISAPLWWAGVILQSVFVIIVISTWIRRDHFEIHHLNPAWFIPVVGCMIIPIAGVEHFSAEFSWFFLSIGIFWWMVLSIIIIYRMIFHEPLQDKLVPTLFILFAPPVIGFISVTKLMGGLTIFGNMFYYIGLFLFVLILAQFEIFAKIRFYLSWWAYSFPLAALSISTLLVYNESGLAFFGWLSWAIFGLLNLALAMLLIKTIIAISRSEICIDE